MWFSKLFLLALQQLFRLAQRFGLLLELFVRLLEFILLALQFSGEGLRLQQQIFRAGIGLDRVQDDADALGQLIAKREVRVAANMESREFVHSLDFALE